MANERMNGIDKRLQEIREEFRELLFEVEGVRKEHTELEIERNEALERVRDMDSLLGDVEPLVDKLVSALERHDSASRNVNGSAYDASDAGILTTAALSAARDFKYQRNLSRA